MARKCSTCGEFKDLSFFGKDRTKPLGHSYRCKKCTREADRIRSREKMRVSDPVKKRARHEAVKTFGKPKTYNCAVLNCPKRAEHLHHYDYREPLAVIPLCAFHHGAAHSMASNIQNEAD